MVLKINIFHFISVHALQRVLKVKQLLHNPHDFRSQRGFRSNKNWSCLSQVPNFCLHISDSFIITSSQIMN